MNKQKITKDILIEDLVNDYAFSVKYMMEKGIRCIMCGEPIWGTLEEAAKQKDFSESEINEFVMEMKKLADNEYDNIKTITKIETTKL